MTAIVNVLTARGVISCATADGDRRAIGLTATGAGQQAVQTWQATGVVVVHLALSAMAGPQRRGLAAAVPATGALARPIGRPGGTPATGQVPR